MSVVGKEMFSLFLDAMERDIKLDTIEAIFSTSEEEV